VTELANKRIKKVLKKAVTGINPENVPLFAERRTSQMDHAETNRVLAELEKIKVVAPEIALEIKPLEKREEVKVRKEDIPKELPKMQPKKKIQAAPLFKQLEAQSKKKDTSGAKTFPVVSTTGPIVLEFPKITEDIKSKMSLKIKGSDENKVRGLPFGGHVLPEGEKSKKIESEWEPPEIESVDTRYPLIEPYAYVSIHWEAAGNELMYSVIEPPLTPKEKRIFEKLREMISDLLDINLMQATNTEELQEYLKNKINRLIRDYEIQLSESEYYKIIYYIYRNFLGLGKIEPMMHDINIEDISCDGVGIPLFIFHRKFGSLKTNVVFETDDELNTFITKLAQRCGKHISVAEPLLDGALPDGSRLSATFSAGGDIATKGSTFTIRKFTKDPLTIVDLMNYGTLPATMAAYLWMAIEFRNSILVSGGTATGKTSSLNTMCLFLHPEAKIVSIEDTAELRLPHEHWIAKIARPGYGQDIGTGSKRGEISMFDLLKTALRERPEVIIVGEVRGQEAYVLFQGMATGHAGLATIHGENMDAVVNRLTTPPINLSPGLIQHLNLVIVMQHAHIKGIDVRRVKEVVEIIGVDARTKKPITNQIFRWVPSGDYYEFASDRSYILNRIIDEKGVSEKSVWSELNRRKDILAWMKKRGIRYYKDVGNLISTYYRNPEAILEKIYGDEEDGNSSIQQIV
jgi:flagellar protein FlaI